jgi:NADH:ubiquinone oxidoreductase subunit 2 (subunit N)
MEKATPSKATPNTMGKIVEMGIVVLCLIMAERYDNPALWRVLITIVVVKMLVDTITAPRIENFLRLLAGGMVAVMIYWPQWQTIPFMVAAIVILLASGLIQTFRPRNS